MFHVSRSYTQWLALLVVVVGLVVTQTLALGANPPPAGGLAAQVAALQAQVNALQAQEGADVSSLQAQIDALQQQIDAWRRSSIPRPRRHGSWIMGTARSPITRPG